MRCFNLSTACPLHCSKQMLRHDSFLMNHSALQMCYYPGDAPFKAHLSFARHRQQVCGDEIFIFVRIHGDVCVILIQLMPHCSLWVVHRSQGYLCERCGLLNYYLLFPMDSLKCDGAQHMMHGYLIPLVSSVYEWYSSLDIHRNRLVCCFFSSGSFSFLLL